ncbi:hypothetical protein EBI_23234 [Enterocytozoon bieneusi H348]|nr:hypothetical protein EBI_23234 [Enterocytozoon bieneusi H348]|eukprot:XP_001827897.1 hypothetical protein EBI_23234 [Enterocytozoon bieneusi H348]
MDNFSELTYKICTYIEINTISDKIFLKLIQKYMWNEKIMLTLVKKLYKQGVYELASLWLLFLTNKFKSKKYNLLAQAIDIMRYVTNTYKIKKNLLFFDDTCIINSFQSHSCILYNSSFKFILAPTENIIIEVNNKYILANEPYKIILQKLKEFYDEPTNLSLMRYLVQKNNIRIVKSIREFRFLLDEIIYKMNYELNTRLITYLINYTPTMNLTDLFYIYL